MKKFLSLSLFLCISYGLLKSQPLVTIIKKGTTTWVCPANVTSVQVECYGAGGAGGGTTTNSSHYVGGGGAGGNYVKNTSVTVVPGTSYTVSIGVGGINTSATGAAGGATSFSGQGITTITAAGGGGGFPGNSAGAGAGGTYGATGSNAGYSGSYTYRGGSGAAGAWVSSSNSTSGGGGSSAGVATNGNNGTAPTGGTAPVGGYAGTDGLTVDGQPTNDINGFGFGGAGARGSALKGSVGGDGFIKISYFPISQSYYSLDEIPTKWSKSTSSTFSISTLHSKSGGKSLRWDANANNSITIDSLGITSSQTYSSNSASAQIFIYSLVASNDTLVFQFFDDAGVVQRQGRMLLNFTGWRDYHRNYRYDYNSGWIQPGNELPGFNLKKCKIIYKPVVWGSSISIFFDEAKFIGDLSKRFPGPHMIIDKNHFQKTASLAGGSPLESWDNQPDIAVNPASSTEITDLNTVKNLYPITASTPSGALVTAAKNYVTSCQITTNADGTINGRGMLFLNDVDTLYAISKHVLNLINAYKKLGDTDAKTQLILFTRYLLDQGLAEGGRNVIPTNTYTEAREFPTGFMLALPEYPADLRTEVIKMLKWSVEFNKIYSPNYIIRLNADYYHVKSLFLFQLVFNSYNDQNTQVRDLKCLSRFMGTLASVGDGGRDGIKPDGMFYHHRSNATAYAVAYNTWVGHAYNLKNTVYRLGRLPYDTVSMFFKNIFLKTSEGVLFPNSIAGRSIFPTFPITNSTFRKLVEIGGDVLGDQSGIDTEMASIYRYIFNDTYYNSIPMANLDGFYQNNYAQLGIQRHKNWIAGMRGFTNKIYGTEIFADENVYGRYASYGALEVIYNGDRVSSGTSQNGAGWNWNVIPGTTTVHLPFSQLKPNSNGTREEYQVNSFAGALSAGKDGVFALDFLQDSQGYYTTSNLQFKKSVFAFDSVFICLGSGIKATGSLGNIRTNLFQAVNATSNPSIYLNSTTATTANMVTTYTAGAGGYWILNGQTTGFFIPGNGVNNNFTVTRGTQTIPLPSSYDGSQTATTNVSMAWIDHGTNSTAAKYQYVMIPGTTAPKMLSLSPTLANGTVYQVLSQTDTLHAVKYLPTNSTSYAFFNSNSNVNIGRVKSLTGKALVNIREVGDTLLLTITNPDLNTIDVVEPAIEWNCQPNTVSLKLIGRWRVVKNNAASVLSNGTNSLTITSQIYQGAQHAFKLVPEDYKCHWENNEKNWNYNLGAGTGVLGSSFTGNNNFSVSSVATPGFLPYPNGTAARVAFGSTGSGRYDLVSPDSLRITANSGSLNKLSLYGLTPTAVSCWSFKIKFGSSGNDGNWMLGFGNGTSGVFTSSSNIGSTPDPSLFGVLRWEMGVSDITFKQRIKTGSTTTSYATINSTLFSKGQSYSIDICANNDSNNRNYSRENTMYTVAPGKYDLWVNGQRVVLLDYVSEATPLTTISSIVLTSAGNTLPTNNSAKLTINGISANYVEDTSQIYRINHLTTDNIIVKDVEFEVYPNPAKDNLFVKTNSLFDKTNVIRIFDVFGRERLLKSIDNNSENNVINVDVSSLESNPYIIIIQQNGVNYRKVFLKK